MLVIQPRGNGIQKTRKHTGKITSTHIFCIKHLVREWFSHDKSDANAENKVILLSFVELCNRLT